MRLIDADSMLEYLDLMYDREEDADDPYNVGVLGAINYIKHKAPSIETKHINYYDDKEKVWKIGSVITYETN